VSSKVLPPTNSLSHPAAPTCDPSTTVFYDGTITPNDASFFSLIHPHRFHRSTHHATCPAPTKRKQTKQTKHEHSKIKENADAQRALAADLADFTSTIKDRDEQLAAGELHLTKDVAAPIRGRGAPSTSSSAAAAAAAAATPEFLDRKAAGNAAFKAGDFESAVELYSECVTMAPGAAVAYANRAMALLRLRHFVAADDDCTRALAIDAANIKVLFRRATVRAELGQLDDAAADVGALLQLYGKHGPGRALRKRVNTLKAAATQRRAAAAAVETRARAEHAFKTLAANEKAAAAASSPASPPPSSSSSSSSSRRVLIEEVNGSDGSDTDEEETETRGGDADADAANVEKAPAASPSSPVATTTTTTTTSSSPASPRSFTAPKNTVECSRTFASLKASKSPVDTLAYLRCIDAQRLPALVKTLMDGSFLATVVAAVATAAPATATAEDCTWLLATLAALARTARFGVAVMMLGDAEAATMTDVFRALHARMQTEETKGETASVASKWDVEL
jgi:tetratricopeptide (TPR) repeat protein